MHLSVYVTAVMYLLCHSSYKSGVHYVHCDELYFSQPGGRRGSATGLPFGAADRLWKSFNTAHKCGVHDLCNVDVGLDSFQIGVIMALHLGLPFGGACRR